MLREYGIRACKTVDELHAARPLPFSTPIQQDKRKQFKISVIDDQPFEAGVNLRSYGYNITEIGDIKNISEIEQYPIVLCDLMAVGLHFDKKNQGAAVIQEIHRNFPATLIAAYSGSSLASEPVQKAKSLADEFIEKDADIETWVEKLDQLMATAADSTFVWYRIRKALVNEHVNSRDILRLEDAYVRSILRNDSQLTLLRKTTSSANFTGAASNIIQGLISSTIFRALGGF